MRGILPWMFLGTLAALAPSWAAAEPPPVIERLEPTAGPPGTEVEIVGRHIHPKTRLFLGDSPLPVVGRRPGRWKVRIPEGAETGPIILRTPGGNYRGPRFRVAAPRPPPTIASVSPSRGAPGTEVTIKGSHFSARPSENAVTLSGRALIVRSATPSTLHVLIPDGATSGKVEVRVVQAGVATGPDFEVAETTRVERLEPRVAAPGAELTIVGAGFASRARDNRVFLHSRPMPVSKATSERLTVRIPPRAESGPVVVDVRGGGRVQSEEPLLIQEVPRLKVLSPRRGPPGHEVRIAGVHFGDDVRHVRVSLGEYALRVRAVTDREIVAELPSGVKSGAIKVFVHGIASSNEKPFAVMAPLTIASIAPRSGPVGSTVEIRGTGFSERISENRVTLSGTPARVERASGGSLRVRVPRAKTGPFEVSVTDSGTVRTGQPFVVTEPPVVRSVWPLRGGPGTEVTLRGSGFGDKKALVEVLLGGRPMAIKSLEDTEIVAIVPEGARTGSLSVRVRLEGTATARRDFQVTE